MKKAIGFMCALAMMIGALSVGAMSVSAAAKIGDLNGDGERDMRDAFALYAAMSGSTTLTDDQKAVSDMNKDGEYDMRDAFSLYAIASGAATAPDEEEPDDPYYTDPMPGDDIFDDDWGEE